MSPLELQTNGTWTTRATITEANGLAEGSALSTADLELLNSTAEVTGTGLFYTITLTPRTQGKFSVRINKNAVRDAAGNGNTRLDPVDAQHDMEIPVVTIGDVPAAVNAPFRATYTFNESVGTTFDIADVRAGLVNATASAFRADPTGTEFSALITPIAEGPITLGVNANAAHPLV